MIGLLGGTGPEGRGLALRFALAGEQVIIGSRDQARAEEAVNRVQTRGKITGVQGATNAHTAQEADTVILTVPYEAQAPLLAPLAGPLEGKTVISTVSPLAFENGLPSMLAVPEGSASAQVQRILPRSTVVAALHHVSAVDLWEPEKVLEGDVLVCSNDNDAKARVIDLVQHIPDLRAVDGGPLANARYVEEITALLLNLNRVHHIRTGIRITGLETG
jgi:NADPH-dependent F420 reductase